MSDDHAAVPPPGDALVDGRKASPAEGLSPKRWLAVVLSIVLAGMGHAYVGRTRRAFVIWIILCGLATLAVVALLVTRSPWPLVLLAPMALNRLVFAVDVARIAPATYQRR